MNRTAAAAVVLLFLSGCYSGPGTDPDPASTTRVLDPEPSASPAQSAGTPAGEPGYSFTAHYDAGSINSHVDVATPNHLGAVVLPVVVANRPAQALVVLASFRYTYHLSAGRGDELRFAIAKPLAVGGPDHAFVDVSTGNRPPQRAFDASLSPAPASGPQWRFVTVPLRKYAGKRVSITFGCDAIGGDATGAWAAFADPVLRSGLRLPKRIPVAATPKP